MAALTAAGHRPGLGTVLVGDDPGSRWYVNAKHGDCAEVGIGSIQRELPASATQDDVLAVVAELNADPACNGYIVQLPLPRHIDEYAVLEAMDPEKDADGLHPKTSAGWCSTSPVRCRAPPWASSSCCGASTCPSPGPRSSPTAAGRPSRPLGLLLNNGGSEDTMTPRQPASATRPPRSAGRRRRRRCRFGRRFTADMVKPGAAVLDVGSAGSAGKIAGDVAPDVVEVAGRSPQIPEVSDR